MSKSISRKMSEIKQIFKDRNVLLSAYDPISLDDVVCRDEVINEYQDHLKYVLENFVPDNIFIYGKSGTGKTMLTDLVLKDVQEVAEEYSINITIIHINCENDNTENSIWQSINNQMPLTDVTIRRKIGNSCPKHTSYFKELLDNYEGILILVFDEVDKVITSFDSIKFINKIIRIKSDKSKLSPCAICITNDVNFTNNIPSNVKSGVAPIEMIIPPYDNEQLEAILNERAKIGFAPNALEPNVIKLCAALGAQEHGDARRTIELLKIAGNEANNREINRIVTEEDVYVAKKKQEEDILYRTLQRFPTQSNLVLLAGISVVKNRKESTITAIYDVYTKFCKHIDYNILSYRRVADIITELVTINVIKEHMEHKGRRGRYKVIDIPVTTMAVESRLYELHRIDGLKGYKIPTFNNFFSKD